jgi:hypothetical protein
MANKKSVPRRTTPRALEPATQNYTHASVPAVLPLGANLNSFNVYIGDHGTSTGQQAGAVPFIPQSLAVRHLSYVHSQSLSQAAHAPMQV